MNDHTSESDILDFAVLDQLRDFTGTPAHFVDLYSLFMTTSTKDIGTLAHFLRKKQVEEFRKEAHRIKGGVGSIGATKLYQLLDQLYSTEADELANNRAAYIEELRDTLAETTEALTQYCLANPDLQVILLTTSAGE